MNTEVNVNVGFDIYTGNGERKELVVHFPSDYESLDFNWNKTVNQSQPGRHCSNFEAMANWIRMKYFDDDRNGDDDDDRVS